MRTEFLLISALLCVGAAGLCVPANSGEPSEVILHPAPAPGPLDNPLKGWCTYMQAGSIRQPYSMVYQYVSWKELEPREGDYRFEEWERRAWEKPEAEGKHIVFRVYVDYPGRASGVPDWMVEKGVKMTRYTDHGGGLSPDYEDERLVSGLERLISKLGERYNRHPRIAFLQMGLLGFWGEWHTWPRDALFASRATQKRVLEAAGKAFPDKIVMTRNPGSYAGALPWIGFFDDMFPEDTDGPEDWKFLPRMRQTKRGENWKKACIGGEMVPRGALRWLGDGYEHTIEMAKKAHFTWVGPYNPALERNQSEEFVRRSQTLVRTMGYEYVLQEIQHPARVAAGGTLRAKIRGVNQGVAPFYYPWQVRFALLNDQKQVVSTFPTDVDIRRWLPGDFRLESSLRVKAPPGRYTLALGIYDPWQKRPAIKFANALPVHEGWTLLSSLTVTPRNKLK